MRSVRPDRHRLAAGLALLVALAGCTGDADAPQRPRTGGTLYVLATVGQLLHLDPQRTAATEDSAFLTSYLVRTLTSYAGGDAPDATRVVPDLATDAGHPADGARTWSFTLRQGVTFATGEAIGCADVKYGVSRAFATDLYPGALTPAVALLDIPTGADGRPTYRGPYTGTNNNTAAGNDSGASNDTAAFDAAVACSPDNRTITFHLSRPVGDFPAAVTSPSFSPVPRHADTRDRYDTAPIASGPYQIAKYTPGSRLVLDRNPHWAKASDPIRGAYPDHIDVGLNVEPTTIDRRIIAGAGTDRFAVAMTQPGGPAGRDASPAAGTVSGTGADVRFVAINVRKVPILGHRQAILAAIDRGAVDAALDPDATPADGLISPALALDYTPTHIWDDLAGEPVPAAGDPDHARRLIADAGAPMPPLTIDYDQADPPAAIHAIVDSLARAGISVTPRPIPPADYYQTIFDTAQADALMLTNQGPDWANASTIIPPLLTSASPRDLSRFDDASFSSQVAAAQATTDRVAQGRQWAALNTEAMRHAVIIPLTFEKERRLVGSLVGGAAISVPHQSLDYAALWVDTGGTTG